MGIELINQGIQTAALMVCGMLVAGFVVEGTCRLGAAAARRLFNRFM